MDRRCRLTLAYLQGVGQHANLNSYMHEPLIQELRHVEESAETAGNSTTIKRLRSFLCVEIMYHRLCCMALSKADCHREAVRLSEFRADRSWEGLGQVIQVMEEMSDEVTGVDVALSFEMKGRLGEADANRMIKASMDPAQGMFRLCVDAATRLRSCLRLRDSVFLNPIGALLATGCQSMNELPVRWVLYASELVRVTEGSAVRAWDLQPK
jgi:hypothetical protein